MDNSPLCQRNSHPLSSGVRPAILQLQGLAVLCLVEIDGFLRRTFFILKKRQWTGSKMWYPITYNEENGSVSPIE